MKIIRKRKGFTTNSSGASEWVPPEATSTNSGAGASPAPGNTGPLMTLPPLRGTTQQPAASPGWLHQDSPLVKFGFVGLLILCLFVIEKIIRRIWKKIRRNRDEE